ncbi:glycerol-3-phosphate cytidylyltransferase, partial [Enterococcus faecalis]|uniref:glycerol-3-phosphate cytidylyltransferase n=1 Tax=Enterococcus faecalis TaxID=1351 RepID=UPI003CC61E13
FKKGKDHGDNQIVGLSTDAFNYEKKKQSYFSYEKRKQILEAIRYVDLVIPETSWKQKVSEIAEFKIDTLFMGDDWQGAFDFLEVETTAK